MVKRIFDLLAALVGLMLLAPVLLIFALVIRVDSRGGALFRQTRVGRWGVPFTVLKFRTMHSDVGGKLLTVGTDPRVTRVGKVLRRYKLDELPQLWNVLTGDMSLVGPRPEVPAFVQYYPVDKRHLIQSVRPGITDPASIEYVDEAEILAQASNPEKLYIEEVLPAKLAHYEAYVRNQSFMNDLAIVFKTFRTIGYPRRRL